MRMLTLSIMLACVAAAARAQQPLLSPHPEKEPTSAASGILRVTAEPSSGLADEDLLVRLIASSTIERAAIGNVSKKAAESPIADVASIEARSREKLPGEPAAGVGLIRLKVKSFDERVDATRLLTQIAAALENFLQDLDTAHAAQKQRFVSADARVLELADNLRNEREALATMAAVKKVDVDPALAAQKRLRIETELTSLDAQLQGLKARRQIIEAQIGKLSKQIGQSPASQATEKALEARLDVQRAGYKIILESNKRFVGSVTKTDIQLAEAKVLEAEAELARFRAQSAQEGGGERVAQLAARLDDTAIEIAETEARRAALQKQLEAAASSSDVDMKRVELELLEAEYRRAAEELSQLRTTLSRHIPPRVTVIQLGEPK